MNSAEFGDNGPVGYVVDDEAVVVVVGLVDDDDEVGMLFSDLGFDEEEEMGNIVNAMFKTTRGKVEVVRGTCLLPSFGIDYFAPTIVKSKTGKGGARVNSNSSTI
jgi:hypothetical protein